MQGPASGWIARAMVLGYRVAGYIQSASLRLSYCVQTELCRIHVVFARIRVLHSLSLSFNRATRPSCSVNIDRGRLSRIYVRIVHALLAGVRRNEDKRNAESPISWGYESEVAVLANHGPCQ